jgi:hypothetical protein
VAEMTAEDSVDALLAQWDLATRGFLKGNPESTVGLYSHRQDVTVANPFARLYVDGSRLLRLLSTPQRRSEMARLLTLRT